MTGTAKTVIIATLTLAITITTILILGRPTPTKEPDVENVQIEYWETVVANNPTYVDGWLELARAHHKNNNQSEFRKAINKAVEISPNSQKVLGTMSSLGL